MTRRITPKSLVGEEQMGVRRVITDIRVLQRETVRFCRNNPVPWEPGLKRIGYVFIIRCVPLFIHDVTWQLERKVVDSTIALYRVQEVFPHA